MVMVPVWRGRLRPRAFDSFPRPAGEDARHTGPLVKYDLMKAKSANLTRCSWPSNPLSIRYHDQEWGLPQHDDRVLFEFLILEGAQAGLSWDTVLQKRENYRAAFDGFNPQRIARYDRRKQADPAAQSGHHPQPPQNRIRGEECEGLSRRPEGIRFLRHLHLAVRRRDTAGECMAYRSASSSPHSRIGRHEQRSQKARLQLRGLNHLLRLHASRGDGERSQRGVLPLCPRSVHPRARFFKNT